ncbi:hypothetical protein [Pseudoroseomonas cervicalis]|uniref:hypothetical protein n=1 Tax=Teichococcus cervicalis TaxID=204525 RepID=UPI0022F15F15|nr:hypothetical protein [Pseudoroseomonas cervicalis]WBV45557.1 hypothetical protein PFY06_21330 [Pseudoroseomonas cervicalis]
MRRPPALRRALRNMAARHAPALLLALAAGPALGQPAPREPPAPPGGAPPATAAEAAPLVRVRTGQHADRGRVVLNLGRIPPHSLRRVGEVQELRLQGSYRLDLSELRRLAELAGIEAVQEGGETVLRLRPGCDCTAELGQVGGALYIDLRRPPAPGPAPAAPRGAAPAAAGASPSPAQLAEARRRLVEDAVRLGLMGREQAEAVLRQAPPAAAPPAATPPAQAPAAPRDDLAGLREAMLGRLALLNGTPPPGGAAGAAPGAAPGTAIRGAAPRRRPPCRDRRARPAPSPRSAWPAGPPSRAASSRGWRAAAPPSPCPTRARRSWRRWPSSMPGTSWPARRWSCSPARWPNRRGPSSSCAWSARATWSGCCCGSGPTRPRRCWPRPPIAPGPTCRCGAAWPRRCRAMLRGWRGWHRRSAPSCATCRPICASPSCTSWPMRWRRMPRRCAAWSRRCAP